MEKQGPSQDLIKNISRIKDDKTNPIIINKLREC
jgi:CRISPR/Cas system-associated endoribonuclease Cas2